MTSFQISYFVTGYPFDFFSLVSLIRQNMYCLHHQISLSNLITLKPRNFTEEEFVMSYKTWVSHPFPCK